MEKSIYELKLHEKTCAGDYVVTRVPGGWLYLKILYLSDNVSSTCTFVPFHNEFMGEKE